MKTVVFYYTQSGQALSAVQSICRPLEGTTGGENILIYKQIIPLQEYPFPWNSDEFFDTFPETRLGLPPSGIAPIDLSDVEDADLVIVAGQSWFLSPSLPLQSFFTDQQIVSYLAGRNVVFVNACRNMWLMTIRKIKDYLRAADAKLVGHIVLQDKAPNLISAFTIVRWLLHGRKQGTKLLPDAGVRDADITAASRFGEIILRSWSADTFSRLQEQLLSAGAICYKPSIMFMEKAGHRMFGLWAQFVRRKGGFRDPRRRWRIRLFYYYLLVVLFGISPFGQLFFYLTYPCQHVNRHRQEDCNID